MTKPSGQEPVPDRAEPVALHDLPSAKARDPLIVACRGPMRRGRRRRAVRALAFVAGLVVCLVLIVLVALDTGLADGPLTAQARSALAGALGPGVRTSIAGAGVRLSPSGTLQLTVHDVTIADANDPAAIAGAGSVNLDVAALPLLAGRISVTGLDIDGVRLDPKSFGSDKPFDLSSLRIDALGPLTERVFAGVDRLAAILRQRTAGDIHLTDTRIDNGSDGSPPIVIRSMTLGRSADGTINLEGAMAEADGGTAVLNARATAATPGGKITAIDLSVDGLDTRPYLLQRDATGAPNGGLATTIDITATAHRAGEGATPDLSARIALHPGVFYADAEAAKLKPSTVALRYDFGRRRIDIQPSALNIGLSKFPFSGGIVDLAAAEHTGDGSGFGMDVVMNDAVSAPVDSEEPALPFSAKLVGRYFTRKKTLAFDQMAVSTPRGSLAGSLKVEQSDTSPEISFVARIAEMDTGAVKQLWPFWLAKKAREWVLGNLFGGSVHNAGIRLYIPRGKIAQSSDGIDFGPDELQIDFDYDRARLNVAGDIPPLRDTVGHFKLRGKLLQIGLDGATSYFPTGRKVTVADGMFTIPDTDAHPLMAKLDIAVSGGADAVGELVSYRPIDALQRTPYKPADFSGDMTSHVTATFGLIQEQNPPQPTWHVDARLDGVDLAPKVDGRNLKDLKGTLVVDPEKAVLDTDAVIDGVAMHLKLTDPLDDQSPVKKQQVVSARLDAADRKKLLPGLNDVIGGPADVTLTRVSDGVQSVVADLTDATITIPGLGWTKGSGIAAKAKLTATDTGNAITVKDFSLTGDGFSAGGSLTVSGSRLSEAHFSDVHLSARDRFDVDLARQAKSYHISVAGTAIDLRSLIKSVKDTGAGGGGDGAPVVLDAKVDTAYGFNGERLSGLDAHYAGTGDAIDSLDARAVTSSGEAFVAKVTSDGSGRDVLVTSGDGGAVARFADIYGRLKGGLLKVALHKSGDGPYRGTLDLREFSVMNENALNSLASSRSSSGMSLRDSVNKPMDLENAQFQRGFARITLGNDSLTVSDGVVRGPTVGSTFQGTAFDAKGNMNLTGTFMPAYGLNRLFAEVPIVGALLGNGRDRGLIGITFRLTGKASSPKLEVNPLSVIAPGIFRQIFEF